jgi:hypothetical protein
MMKPAAIVFFLLLAPMVLWAGDLQISAERKHLEGGVAAKQSGQFSKGSEKWQYAVKVINGSFKPMPALRAEYVVFVQRQELGGKVGVEVVQRVKGQAALPPTNPQATASFESSEITLRVQAVAGALVYSNGGRIKATDAIEGIWVKLFDGDNQVGEYANPTTLSSKNVWDK